MPIRLLLFIAMIGSAARMSAAEIAQPIASGPAGERGIVTIKGERYLVERCELDKLRELGAPAATTASRLGLREGARPINPQICLAEDAGNSHPAAGGTTAEP